VKQRVRSRAKSETGSRVRLIPNLSGRERPQAQDQRLWWRGAHLGYASWRLLQFDYPNVAIFVDRTPVFIGFAFFEVHRFFTDSADGCVGNGALRDDGSPTVVRRLNYGLFNIAQA